jgi:prepilin-type processing-associated H-X9-DG protein
VGWWVRSTTGEESGPYSFLELQTLVRQERVSPSDRVRVGVIGAWRPAPEILRPDPDTIASPEQTRETRRETPSWRRSTSLLVIVGAIAIAGAIAAAVIVARPVVPASEQAASDACLGNLRHLASALRMYAGDNDGRLPHWSAWGVAAMRHIDRPTAFQCPAAPREPGYAYNAALGGVPVDLVPRPGNCAMLWDAGALGPSLGLARADNPPRHHGGDNYAFVDGHAAWRKRGARVRVTVQPP